MEQNKTIDQLHDHLLVIMKEIHSICVAHNIQYSLAGGSLIGALRHNGFIPWDDDMDIMMPYEEFVKFTDIICTIDHPWLEGSIVGRTKDCYRTILKVCDKRTTLIQSTNSQPKGVFIDVFPYVYSGNTRIGSMFEYYMHHLFIAPMVRKVNVYKDKNQIKEYLLTIIGKAVPTKVWLYLINSQYDRLKKKKTKYSSDLDGTLNGIILSEYFEGVELRQFETEMFFCLKRAHDYLTSDFGDYMQLPPVEKRIPQHIFYLNLNLPYSEYKA